MRSLRRLVWFIASRLFIILLLLGMFTVTFYYAMNATNIYIIIKDGMARRAQVVMMDESVASLDKYFSSSWIERDALVINAANNVGPYENCNITGFDHRITLSRVWCWPWDTTATATVTERIPAIDGRSRDASGVPAWQNATYSVILTQENGNWKIRNLTMVETVTND